MSRPSTTDLTSDHPLALLARTHWLLPTPSKLPTAIPELWSAIQTSSEPQFSLLLLEQLQALERYLWPTYHNDTSSNQHVLLLVLLVNVKVKEHLPSWVLLASRAEEFSGLFRRVLGLSLDVSLDIAQRREVLVFLVNAFQSLDQGIVRKECAALVSVGVWTNLHSETAREEKLSKSLQLQKAWRASGKKYDSASPPDQARLRFERSWLYSLLLDFLDRLYDAEASKDTRQENLLYCERFLELLCDLLSQLPTRRYVATLLQDLNLIPAIKLSPLYQDGDESALLREMLGLLSHYASFPIDDQTGKQLSRADHDAAHNGQIAKLQNVALKLHPEKLKILVLANYGSLSSREELLGHTKILSSPELVDLCSALGLRTTYPEKSNITLDRSFYEEVLAATISEDQRHYTDTLASTPILPTEQSLYAPALLRLDSYTGDHPLAIPKQNLQYLSLPDLLFRSFTLARIEALSSLRAHIGSVLKTLSPRMGGGVLRWDGFSKMAIPITKPAVISTLPAEVGEEAPAEVQVEVSLDVSKLQEGVRREWEELRQGEVVYLVGVQPVEKEKKGEAKGQTMLMFEPAERAGVKVLRCGIVVGVLDDKGRMLRRDDGDGGEINGSAGGSGGRPRQRRLLLKLDAEAYKTDLDSVTAGGKDVYDSINLIIRRRPRENNFKPVLESLRQLALTPELPVPNWLQEVLLGYGDPAGASYKRLEGRLRKVDYRDTFLDWGHLVEGVGGKGIEVGGEADGSFGPPYVLESSASPTAEVTSVVGGRASKKRRRDQEDGVARQEQAETLRVTTYKPVNEGPYAGDVPKKNGIRFTPTQIEAITSGVQPGLTVIVGPPGTGKTDVVTQIVSLLYRNFPGQRILVVAQSNQALNQLFQKIVGVGIEQRHLLRLGHGEAGLELGQGGGDLGFGKAGRVESFMERGLGLLGEVQRLAQSLGAVGHHGGSCETASYFEEVFVRPGWKRFWDGVEGGVEDVGSVFPFGGFFSDAPQPLFRPEMSREECIEVAKGCERHIGKIFEELAAIRPFEILKREKEKADYLLVSQARIVAMTATHAAMKRREIAGLGFRYENVVVEEAAQVTEAEGFVPFVMQDGKNGGAGLQRVVLVGDHLQNSPVVQNAALRGYGNLEQSLFQRLMRLGVPHVVLDAQGRSRPSIAELVKWRYPRLTNLPFTSTAPEFARANAGFRFEYQFIEVGEYKGQGETEPTPHFVQNLGEAEYAVALFQYMRLLGYPAEKISILCTYAGQRALIRDVLGHRCKGNRLFGMPGWVGTVDKYQGEQNDYVILSLVRTKGPGYLRDVRRLTVALSRARLGLYVLGRREVFESSLELREAFGVLFERGQKLGLVTGEMWPAERGVGDEVEGTVMEGVEHLGQYVYEMTQAKVKALKEGGGVLPPPAIAGRVEDEEEGEGDEEEEVVVGELEELEDEDVDAMA
ncbi:hypothetical protein LTR10_006397 [Elasticomyces elasticus]|nr:hypothetical protein LTR10_006397 [Elasticomyces elasticus]KAK4966556.1 hypothetical protein LTR42_010866 [Elasticomyces elasticus]